MLGGRGGSGKSWFRRRVYDPDKAIVLDADDLKARLGAADGGYEGWTAYLYHDESADLFDRITAFALEERLNLVHDSTMKTAGKAIALVRAFDDAGYRVEVHYMHVPRHTAARRALWRFERKGYRGRYVPLKVILGNTGNETSFDRVRRLVKTWSFRDNSGQIPRLIAEGIEASP